MEWVHPQVQECFLYGSSAYTCAGPHTVSFCWGPIFTALGHWSINTHQSALPIPAGSTEDRSVCDLCWPPQLAPAHGQDPHGHPAHFPCWCKCPLRNVFSHCLRPFKSTDNKLGPKWHLPAPQLLQDVDPAGANRPAGQLAGDWSLFRQLYPSVQLSQSCWPVPVWYWPSGHTWGTDIPSVGHIWPEKRITA